MSNIDDSRAFPRAAWVQTDGPRHVAHKLVGQAHAVLVFAYRDDAIEYCSVLELREAAVSAAPDM